MLRLLLAAALVVAVTPHGHYRGHGHPYYGLSGLLSHRHIPLALRLVTTRYSGIAPIAAAQIVRLSITQVPVSYLRIIKYTSVPTLHSGLRYRYLQTLYGGLPSPFYGSYISPLTSYLGGMGISVTRTTLINPLSLTDYYLGVNQVSPLSTGLFNQFFSGHLLGLTRPHYSGYAFPGIPHFVSRLSSFRFPGRYFGPFGGVGVGPIGVGPLSSPYTGPGSAFLGVYPSLGLPYPVYPAHTLGGLNSYLVSRHVQFPDFVSYIRSSSVGLTPLIRSISLPSYRTYIRRIRVINESVFQRDLLPLFASRYYAYPRYVRSRIYYKRRTIGFPRLLRSYFRSPVVRRLSSYRTYTSGFVRSALDGFDGYCRKLSYRRLRRYRGPYWLKNLLRRKWRKG